MMFILPLRMQSTEELLAALLIYLPRMHRLSWAISTSESIRGARMHMRNKVMYMSE